MGRSTGRAGLSRDRPGARSRPQGLLTLALSHRCPHPRRADTRLTPPRPTWSDTAGINFQNGARLPQPPGRATFTTTQTNSNTSSDGLFINDGLFEKSVNTGPLSDTELDVPFDQSSTGSVSVLAGSLSFLGGGTSSGSFTGDAGTTLSFSGQTFTPTSSIAGDTVSFSGGDTIAGSYSAQTATVINYGYGEPEEFIGTVTSVGSFIFVPDVYDRGGIADFSPASGPTTLTLSGLTLTDGATLTGSDSFVVTGAFTWVDGGTLAGPSGTSLTAAGQSITMSAAESSSRPLILDGRRAPANGDASHTGVSATFTGGRVDLEPTTRSSTTMGPSRSTPSAVPVTSRR